MKGTVKRAIVAARPGARTRKRAKKGMVAPVPVRFANDEQGLYRVLVARAGAQDRSLSAQIKRYARLGVIAEDNPDLPLSMIEGVLEARAELKAGLGQPYQWGVLERDDS